MTIAEVANALGLSVRAGESRLGTEVTGGYASDLLSCVMAKARQGNVWVTLQSHVNIVAVAVLLQLAGIIVTEGMLPDAATLEKADAEGIPVLTTPSTTFSVVAQLAELGVKGAEKE
jgi:hypothetical protein